jgi:hypothetical protein
MRAWSKSFGPANLYMQHGKHLHATLPIQRLAKLSYLNVQFGYLRYGKGFLLRRALYQQPFDLGSKHLNKIRVPHTSLLRHGTQVAGKRNTRDAVMGQQAHFHLPLWLPLFL